MLMLKPKPKQLIKLDLQSNSSKLPNFGFHLMTQFMHLWFKENYFPSNFTLLDFNLLSIMLQCPGHDEGV